MKFKSRILCLLLVLLMLLSVTAAAAANENTTLPLQEDSANQMSVNVETNNEILGISNSEKSLGATDNNKILCATDDGTFKALQDKIDNAPLGSVVILENNYTNTDNFDGNGIKISKKCIDRRRRKSWK